MRITRVFLGFKLKARYFSKYLRNIPLAKNSFSASLKTSVMRWDCAAAVQERT